MQKTWPGAGLTFMSCSACFLREARTVIPGVAPPTVGWALPRQSLIKRMLYRLVTAHFVVLVGLFFKTQFLCTALAILELTL